MSKKNELPPWQRGKKSMTTPAPSVAPRDTTRQRETWTPKRIVTLATVIGVTIVCLAACFKLQRSNDSVATPAAATTKAVTLQLTNGTLQDVPQISGGQDVIADSTGFKETPPVVPVSESKKCGVPTTWKSLYDCVETNHWEWYIDGVNRYASETGFNWNDVRQWSTLSDDRDVRAILIANWSGKTDWEARNDVRSLVGNDADKLPIVRQDCIVNTRGLEKDTLSQFSDCKRQVRVSLAPLKFEGSKLIGWRNDAGVFIDCYNLWWLGRIVTTQSVPPSAPPPVNPPPAGPPPVNPPLDYVPTCEEVYGWDAPECGYVPPCVNCSPPPAVCPDGSQPPCDQPPPPPTPKEQLSPGNGGPGTGGFGGYGGDGDERHSVDGPPSAPAVVPHDTVAPTSRPTPPATRTQAPVVTPTSVAPPAQQTTAAPSTEPRQTVEVVAPPVTAPTGDGGGADEGTCPASNPLCG